MFKVLKLQKGVVAIVLGILALIAAQIMSSNHIKGSNFVLGVSGVLLIIGALIFIYPIIFAKKTTDDAEVVELKPAAKESGENI